MEPANPDTGSSVRVASKPISGRPFGQSKKRLRRKQGERREVEMRLQQLAGTGEGEAEGEGDGDGELPVLSLERMPLDHGQLRELIHGIVINRISLFGLVRISKLRLDAVYPYQYRSPHSNSTGSPGEREAEEEIQWPLPKHAAAQQYSGSHMTLMLFAFIWRRDNCIAALLRAGCSPIIPGRPSARLTLRRWGPSVMGCLNTKLLPSVAVWVVATYYALRRAVEIAATSNTGGSFDRECQCVECHTNRCHDHTSRIVFAAETNDSCGHNFCEDCFWKSAVSQFRLNRFDDIRCPVCAELLDVIGDSLDIPQSLHVDSGETAAYSNPELECSSALAQNQTAPQRGINAVIAHQKASLPLEIARRSLAKYHSLPRSMAVAESEGIDEAVKKKDKLKKLIAMPYACIVGMFIGATQAQRDLELIKAVTVGNALRLRALVNAGVDLQFTNEYGQTALFIAAWKGHSSCVDALLSCGADKELDDNAKITPQWAAFHGQCGGSSCNESDRFNRAEIAAYLGNTCKPPEALLPLFRVGSLSSNPIDANSDKLYLPRGPYEYYRYLNPPENVPPPTVLIDLETDHAGAGSLYFDGLFSEEFLCQLDHLAQVLPIAPPEKLCSSDRAYFCDALGCVSGVMAAGVVSCLNHHHSQISHHNRLDSTALLTAKNLCLASPPKVFQHMRYLVYRQVGGSLAPHVDLTRTDDADQITSTHTFILYLSDCERGGATVLLKSVRARIASAVKLENIDETDVPELLGLSAAGVFDDMVELFETGGLKQFGGLSPAELDTNDLQPSEVIDEIIPRATKTKDPDDSLASGIRDENTLATVHPKRGRLLLFPHHCPHAGQIVVDVPKLLLRGEAHLSFLKSAPSS